MATFNEVVSGFVAGDVTVSNGTVSNVNGSGTTYTFNATPTPTGAGSFDVVATVASEAATAVSPPTSRRFPTNQPT